MKTAQRLKLLDTAMNRLRKGATMFPSKEEPLAIIH